ncbi:MAG: LLM class F420-dependent oxidoreductase [Dehalococcoidia bacterium]|nr:LLM class F420-dependent oxidoreductase [Dehalococcoidia bacterium]HCV00930.1 LLM class F420-dependent oxidoreductase [Dehalococcoidia bacterium]
MRVGLMIEGQNDLTWERWLHIANLTDRLGFASLFRSDHYFTGNREMQSLEAWLSFAAISREPHSFRFGALVTPITFRRPVNDARMAAQIDLLSGGRFVMGLGAGWNEAEHRAYGIPFPPIKERFDRLDEATRLMRTLWRESPASFNGRFYQLEEAGYQPQPTTGRPPILIGGAGEKRTLRIAAAHADEWNCVTVTEPEGYAHKLDVLEQHCEDLGRDPTTIFRSMMVFPIAAPNVRTLKAISAKTMAHFGLDLETSPSVMIERMEGRGVLSGTTDEVVEKLGKLADLGLEEIVLQHIDFDSDEGPEYFASEIAPQVAHL